MWHPLRLAEDFATADMLTKDRVVFGVGRGYHTREVEVFGSPMRDQDANRELFEEQVDVIMTAFNKPVFLPPRQALHIPPKVPYRGYELEEITLVPRPLHTAVRVLAADRQRQPAALDFMATHGIKGVIGGGAASTVAADAGGPRLAARRCARHGRETELGGDLIDRPDRSTWPTPRSRRSARRRPFYRGEP